MRSVRPPKAYSRAVGRFVAMLLWLAAMSVSNMSHVWSQSFPNPSPSNPSDSSPWQRWLPPPKSLAPDAQAKLLARLRDMVLRDDSSDPTNQRQLSDAEVRLLKDAMKRFGGKLPKGLSPESLDAIPADLISKALSNPELRRQAKEIAEQYMKQEGLKPSQEPNTPNNSTSRKPFDIDENGLDAQPQPTNKASGSQPRSSQPTPNPPRQNSQSQNSRSQNSQTQEPLAQNPFDQRLSDNVGTTSDPKSPDFKELMDKLRKTQEQYEQSKNGTKSLQSGSEEAGLDEVLKEFNNQSTKREPNEFDLEKELQSASNSPEAQNKPNGNARPGQNQQGPPATKNSPSRAAPSRPAPSNNTNNPKPKSSPNTPTPSGASSGNRNTTPSGTSKQENNLGSNPSIAERERRSANRASSEFGSDGAQKNKSPQLEKSPNDNLATRPNSNGPNAAESKDIRKELDRKGLGPTLQKMIDDARANIAKRPKPESMKAPGDAGKVANNPIEGKNGAASNPSTPPPQVARQPDPLRANQNATPQQPPKPDSEISKGLKQAGNYLSDLWSQISKPTNSEVRTSSASSPDWSSAASSPAMKIPDLLDIRLIASVLIVAIMGAIAFYVLRMQKRTEQERNEAIQLQLATRIEEIRSRDDLIRAFHALARQRLKASETWWTNYYVTRQFESAMPQHTHSMRTLSQLYDQARYFPADHQLTEKQINEAKLALKQFA